VDPQNYCYSKTIEWVVYNNCYILCVHHYREHPAITIAGALRLSPTAMAKAFLPLVGELWINASLSNKQCKRQGKMQTEERDDANLHTLSPRMHLCVRGPGEQDCRSDRRGSGGGGGKRSRSGGILAQRRNRRPPACAVPAAGCSWPFLLR
jgi:hypothetical protein